MSDLTRKSFFINSNSISRYGIGTEKYCGCEQQLQSISVHSDHPVYLLSMTTGFSVHLMVWLLGKTEHVKQNTILA